MITIKKIMLKTKIIKIKKKKMKNRVHVNDHS